MLRVSNGFIAADYVANEDTSDLFYFSGKNVMKIVLVLFKYSTEQEWVCWEPGQCESQCFYLFGLQV